MEDAQIIELYWQRDESAMRECENTYGAYCWRIAMNILHSREDAEECLNDVWLRVWYAIPPERPKKLNENLENLTKNGVSIQTVQCVDAPVYHMRLVYVQGENGDYYIPYGSSEDLTNLTNGKVYTAQEIADILE